MQLYLWVNNAAHCYYLSLLSLFCVYSDIYCQPLIDPIAWWSITLTLAHLLLLIVLINYEKPNIHIL